MAELLTLAEVKGITTLGHDTIYRLIREGTFPRPIKPTPSGHASRWLASEIEEWIRSRPRADDPAVVPQRRTKTGQFV